MRNIFLILVALNLISTIVSAQKIEVVEVWGEGPQSRSQGDGNITPRAKITAYGDSWEPNYLVAEVQGYGQQKSSYGKYEKNNVYSLPTYTVKATGKYKVRVGFIAAGGSRNGQTIWSDWKDTDVYVKTVQSTINSFNANKTQYNVNEQISFSGSASNMGSWKIVWLRNGSEADALTSIQHGNNISASGSVSNTAYNGAMLYVYPQANGGGTPVTRRVNFTVYPAAAIINSFITNKSEYAINEQITFTGSVSNMGSWRIVWLKNGSEAEALTSLQVGSNISASGSASNTAYNGAILYVYQQTNGGGTPITRKVSFSVKQAAQVAVINSFTTNKTGYGVNEQITFSGSASNFGSWKIVWLKNGKEAEALTSIQHGSNISAKGSVNSTAYDGAVLYVYPQSNGNGTPVTRKMSFSVIELPRISNPEKGRTITNQENVPNEGGVWYNVGDKNSEIWLPKEVAIDFYLVFTTPSTEDFIKKGSGYVGGVLIGLTGPIGGIINGLRGGFGYLSETKKQLEIYSFAQALYTQIHNSSSSFLRISTNSQGTRKYECIKQSDSKLKTGGQYIKWSELKQEEISDLLFKGYIPGYLPYH